MSHAIFFIAGVGSDASLAEVKSLKATKSVDLSNTTFETLWEGMGFDRREFVALSGDTMSVLWHTTIWDKEPVGVDPQVLQSALDELDGMKYADEQKQINWLYDLADEAEAANAYIWVF